METNSVRLILDIYAAFSRGDIPAVLNSLDAGAELTFEGPGAIPWAGTWRGIEGWVRFFQTWPTAPKKSLCRWSRSRRRTIASWLSGATRRA